MAKHKKEKDPLEQLLDQINYSNLTQEDLMEPNGLVKQLTKRMIEKAMNTEIDDHLGYEKSERTETAAAQKPSKRTMATFLLISRATGTAVMNQKSFPNMTDDSRDLTDR